MIVLRLKQARAILSGGGWSGPELEPFNVVRSRGVVLNREWMDREPLAPMWLECDGFVAPDHHHEGIVQFSVFGALLSVGLGFAEFDLLELVCDPPAGLDNWLRASERVPSHVLELFTKAIRRSKKMGGHHG